MTQETKRPTRAKRKLSDISFDSSDAHIALVSKEQGDGANGHHYALVIKGANFSDEFVEKASKVKVEMEITEYLTRFYHLYWEDAEVLARALGLTTAQQDREAKEEMEEREEFDYEDYITSKVQSIEIMKSLSESENIPEVLSKLTEDEYLGFLKDQEMLEKAFRKVDRLKKQKSKESDKSATADESDNSTNAGVEKSVEPSGSKPVVKEKTMQEKQTETQVIEQEVEVIAKAQFDAIQKAFDEQKQELQKALDLVNEFKAKEKQAIAKARKDAVLDAVKDADKAEVIFKAVAETDDESFTAVVKALKELVATADNSDLFVEKGAQVETEGAVEKESAVARVIKARQAKAAK